MGEAMAWQPIETAPKDGKGVILAVKIAGRPKPVVGEGYYSADAESPAWWWAGESDGDYHAEPIHLRCGPVIAWMPLPEPPDAARSTEEGE